MSRITAEKTMALCSAFLLWLGAAPAVADAPVTVNVTSGTDVGIGFNKLTEGAHDLQVTLHAVDGYTISKSNRTDNTGLHLWEPEEILTPATDHTYAVTGVLPNDGHSVRFHGDLTKGGGGPGEAVFNMAVADLDGDADTNVPPVHCSGGSDPHWPPDGSAGEDYYEAQFGYGLRAPRIWPAYGWPTVEEVEGLDYKILRVALNAKCADETRSFVGNLKFNIQGAGVAIYCGTTTRSQAKQIGSDEQIPVPRGGIFEDFRIVTNGSFDGTVTITATFEWDTGLQQSGVASQAIDDIYVCRVRVMATAPEGRFVATGHYEDSIPLEAVYEFPSGSETYQWSIGGGDGAGTLADANTRTPTFTGTEPGKVQVQVDATGGVYDTLDLVVIEVDDLTGEIPDQEIEDVCLDGELGEHAIPYNTGRGELRGVYLLPVDNPTNPYVWSEHYDGEVDHLTGAVQLSFARPGVYLVKVLRIVGASENVDFLSIWFKSASLNDGQRTRAREYVDHPKPGADLVLISNSPNDNGANAYARDHYPNHRPIGSVDDVIAEINAFWDAQGEEHHAFSVLLIDHAHKGSMSMGDGNRTEAGKYIDGTVATAADRNKLTNACQDKVNLLTLCGCNVGKDEVGGEFLQSLADNGRMAVVGLNCFANWGLRFFWQDHFVIEKGGAFIMKVPQTPPP